MFLTEDFRICGFQRGTIKEIVCLKVQWDVQNDEQKDGNLIF